MVLRGGIAVKDNLTTIDEAFCGQYLAYATGPHTIVGTWIHYGQLGRRLRISQTTWLSAILESEQAWCILYPTESTWLETK